MREQQRVKNLFRRTLTNFIIQIKNKNNVKQGIKGLAKLFENNKEMDLTLHLI